MLLLSIAILPGISAQKFIATQLQLCIFYRRFPPSPAPLLFRPLNNRSSTLSFYEVNLKAKIIVSVFKRKVWHVTIVCFLFAPQEAILELLFQESKLYLKINMIIFSFKFSRGYHIYCQKLPGAVCLSFISVLLCNTNLSIGFYCALLLILCPYYSTVWAL